MAATLSNDRMEVLKTLEHLKHDKQQQFVDLNPVVTSLHSPSCSETSLFSTVDCSSFSSRSDASSFAKDENSPVNPSICVSVSSSIDFIPPPARLALQEVIQDTVLKNGLSPGESGYFEFSFAEGQLLEQGNSSVCLEVTKVVDPSSPGKQDDSYETFPVWTDRTRYCSKDVHSCINPCFDGDDAELHARTSRKKKFARSLGSVISKHLVPSPGPTFRRSSCEKLRSRLALDHPSPLSEMLVLPPTPARSFESREKGYSSSPSPGYVTRYMNSPRLSFVKEKTKPTKPSELSASTSGKNLSLYGTSPRRGLQSKSLGCLRGISAAARAVVPTEDSSSGECKGPLYFATEESVHGGKGRCLPSPRLSFGQAKTASKDENEHGPAVPSMSTQVPSATAHGHLHCVVKNNLPSFVFLVDGLDEVLIAKALRPGSPDRLEAGELVYMFYSWKPRGRAKASWKHWGRKDRPTPDLLGKMTLTSRVVPSETKDGDDSMELEFVLSQGGGSCSPRLSFSTWETGLSPHSSCNKSPSPAAYGCPSPFSVVSPSPGRLPPAASSRYVSMSMVPASLTSPRVRKPDPRSRRRSKKSLSSSPLRPKSDDEKSCFHDDAWSDCESTEAPDVREQSEVEAVIIRIPGGGRSGGSWESLSQQWASKSSTAVGNISMQNSRRSSYCRRFSLPGRFQAAETKENEEENKCRKAPSVKLRELMGVKSEFGKDEGSSGLNPDQVSVTVVLPAGNHGLPRYGAGGPQPLVDRWRAGGRCDCGSWDLGCGLTILQNFSHDQQQQQQQDRSERNVVKFFLQGKVSSSSTLRLGAVMDGLFPISFEAPMSYLQAFGGAVAVIYSRGPRVLECGSSNGSKPPRVPLKPLTSQRRTVALAGYCSPPPACLLDRL